MAKSTLSRWKAGVHIAALVAVFSGPAYGQARCIERADAVAYLSQRYQEKPVALGITALGSVIEVLASKDGATWTIVVTGAAGLTCMFASGTKWRELPEPEGPGI